VTEKLKKRILRLEKRTGRKGMDPEALKKLDEALVEYEALTKDLSTTELVRQIWEFVDSKVRDGAIS
jgi:hypothetical protein